MSTLQTAATQHKRTLLYERRASEARKLRDAAIREAVTETGSPTAVGRFVGISEGAVRKIAGIKQVQQQSSKVTAIREAAQSSRLHEPGSNG